MDVVSVNGTFTVCLRRDLRLESHLRGAAGMGIGFNLFFRWHSSTQNLLEGERRLKESRNDKTTADSFWPLAMTRSINIVAELFPSLLRAPVLSFPTAYRRATSWLIPQQKRCQPRFVTRSCLQSLDFQLMANWLIASGSHLATRECRNLCSRCRDFFNLILQASLSIWFLEV